MQTWPRGACIVDKYNHAVTEFKERTALPGVNLKQKQTRDTSWPENGDKMQVFSSAGHKVAAVVMFLRVENVVFEPAG